MPRILVADPLVPEGLDLLRSQAQVDVKTGLGPGELMKILGNYDVLLVRSETQVTSEVIKAGKSLRRQS